MLQCDTELVSERSPRQIKIRSAIREWGSAVCIPLGQNLCGPLFIFNFILYFHFVVELPVKKRCLGAYSGNIHLHVTHCAVRRMEQGASQCVLEAKGVLCS